MQYISVSLYRKMINHALSEGCASAAFDGLSVQVEVLDKVQAVPAEVFFALHEQLDEALGPGFSVRVGQHMGMSSRTLTRRLSESGLSFRELVRNTQEKVAHELLPNTAHSIGEIAFQTGFSEQSAFSRAFKRWTGQSPMAYRNSL